MAQETIEQYLHAARGHNEVGRLPQAEDLCRQILSQQPDHAQAMHLLGILAERLGRHAEAINILRQAVALQPNLGEIRCDLAIALRADGQLGEAIAAYRQGIALSPPSPEIHYNNLGATLKENGQFDEAIAACRQALAMKSDYPRALYNLGNALQAKGQLDDAMAAWQRAVALNPNFAEAYCNLATALHITGQTNEAMATWRRAIALKPDFAEACCNLAAALKEQGRLDESVAACRQAIALNPGFPTAHKDLANALKETGQITEAIACYRQAITLNPDFVEAHSDLLYTLHLHLAYDARMIAAEHGQWYRRHAEPLKKFIRPHTNDRSPERRLRIGYVSPDFRGHPVARFIMPLLAHHDKNQFEVFAYAQVPVPDAVTGRLKTYTDGWRDIVGLSDAQVADLIRDDRIDILIDLTMHSAHHRLLVFAQKPAPVQVSYLAYCSTTGLETIDYRLSDPYLDPVGEDESVYSEKTIRLAETYWCYQPIMEIGDIGPLPALQQGFITFGCLNNFCKVTDEALTVWAEILRDVPNSRLLLHAQEGSHRQRVGEFVGRLGIESSRVQFAVRLPTNKYFDLYRRIDIALDTFPYGGGTTTCDALWMGVPVVSLVGKTAVGRGGLSILSNLGAPELVARCDQEYVRIATELAKDLPRLRDLRSTLRRRIEQSPLMIAERFTRNVEAAYQQMWRSWCVTAGAEN